MSKNNLFSNALDTIVDASLKYEEKKKIKFITQNTGRLGVVDVYMMGPDGYGMEIDIGKVPLDNDHRFKIYINDLEKLLDYTSEEAELQCNEVLIKGVHQEVGLVKKKIDRTLNERYDKKRRYKELLNKSYSFFAATGTAAVAAGWFGMMMFFENYSEEESRNTLDNLILTGIISACAEVIMLEGLYLTKRTMDRLLIKKTRSSPLNRVNYLVEEQG